jgi:hypothetical protein
MVVCENAYRVRHPSGPESTSFRFQHITFEKVACVIMSGKLRGTSLRVNRGNAS